MHEANGGSEKMASLGMASKVDIHINVWSIINEEIDKRNHKYYAVMLTDFKWLIR